MPNEARSLSRFSHLALAMKFSFEMTHAAETVGENDHLVPGARRLEPDPTRARSAK